MTLLMSLVVGVLFAGATYFLLRRSVIKVLLGVVLLSHAVGLLIFTMGGLHRGAPPIDEEAADTTTSLLLRGGSTTPADPLPQAMVILTAVAGLAFLVAVLALVARAYQTVGSEDMDDLTPPERPDGAPGAPARRE
jgi:multicomponent Na+:H+ antiporter subunit C